MITTLPRRDSTLANHNWCDTMGLLRTVVRERPVSFSNIKILNKVILVGFVEMGGGEKKKPHKM